MIIKKIRLENFRSHKEFTLDFNKKTTMIVGENGCGKTSILEAVFEVLQGKSFKATDREILKRGEDFYRVELELFNGDIMTVFYDGGTNKKVFQVKDKKIGRLSRDNKYPIVLFEPDDLNLVGSSPTHKREYFDRFFGQLLEKYNNSLLKYNKALKQRNELLKEEFLREDLLFSWNVMLAKYGVEVAKIRNEIIDKINKKITEVYQLIAENQDEIKIVFKTQVEYNEQSFLDELEKNFQKDHYLGYTSFGIHRDDYEFVFNNSMADKTASRGEIRSIVLALKFIEAEKLTEKLGKKPIILLDDVFSELDEKRQKCLTRNFKDNQVVITSVVTNSI